MTKKFSSVLFLSLLIFAACETTPTQEISTVDKQIYEDAVNSMNTELCGTIASVEYGADCVLVIQSNELADEAIKNSDSSQCSKIEHDQIKESCLVQVDKLNDEKAKKEAALKQQNEDQSKMQEIQDNLDLNACDELSTEHLKKECILNISTALAEKNKDAKYCQPIEDTSLRGECEKSANS